MQITSYHSSSSGNLYRVDNLLLEAGVPIREIKRALDFRLHEIDACLISHEHGDHAKGAEALMKAGVDVYTSEGTAADLGLKGHRLHVLEAGKRSVVGPWAVLPFATAHDAAEPLGFLLAKGAEKLLFLTDSHYSPHRFQGLTHVMLEVGYDPEILRVNVAVGRVHPEVAKRVIQNHMSIRTALGVLRANDMSRVEEIHLIHLSNNNSNAEATAREARRVTGRPVYVAGE
jgi:phosphoribosyl 1,2-cyclic phosphodiesterase